MSAPRKLTYEMAAEIRGSSGQTLKALAKQYGVCNQAIWQIRAGILYPPVVKVRLTDEAYGRLVDKAKAEGRSVEAMVTEWLSL